MDTDFDLVLGRALIAVAWADGELDEGERVALEDLLLGIDGISPDTWRALHTDLDRPIGAEHRERLLAELDEAVVDDTRRRRAREVVLRLLDRFPAGGPEAALLREIADGLEGELPAPAGTGLFSRLQGVFSSGLTRHGDRLRQQRDDASLWEESLQARMASHWPDDEEWPTPDELHRLCTGAAILAHVVRLDGSIDAGEQDALRDALRGHWGISEGAARLVAELALDETAAGIDLHLALREFQRATTEDERQRFLAVVFMVAAGDGRATYDEIEEVRRIGRGLLLSHQHFISAKLTVPGGRRET